MPTAFGLVGNQKMRIGTKVLLACLIGYAFLDAASVRLLPFEQQAYGLVLATLGLFAALALPRARLHPSGLVFVVSWLALAVLALIQGLWGNHWEMSYLVGDFGVLMMPILLFLACGFGHDDEPSMFADMRVLDAIGYALFAAAIFAFLFGRDPELKGRYEPPNLFLTAWLVARVLGTQEQKDRAKYLIMLMLFGLIAFLSNERTAILLWAGGLVVMVANLRGKTLAVIGGAVAVLALVGVSAIGMMGDSGEFESRFSKLEGGNDDSLQGRFNEVSDMLGTVGREWGPIEYLIGAGHGATFKPVLSFPPRNVIDGRVHNIHIGPALMFYRYGLMGLFGWLWWLLLILRSVPRALSPQCKETERVIILAGGLVFLNSFLRNTFVDPISCFAVAGLFHLHLVQDRPWKRMIS
jgi:hypothetical protein